MKISLLKIKQQIKKTKRLNNKQLTQINLSLFSAHAFFFSFRFQYFDYLKKEKKIKPSHVIFTVSFKATPLSMYKNSSGFSKKILCTKSSYFTLLTYTYQ